jgi:hypothetical protein
VVLVDFRTNDLQSGVCAYGTSFGNVDMNMFLVNDADSAKIPTIYERLAAGNVAVTIHAESEEGFDHGKLQNGVLEPLREADLIE